MQRWRRFFLKILLTAFLLINLTLFLTPYVHHVERGQIKLPLLQPVASQTINHSTSDDTERSWKGYPVTLDGTTLFTINASTTNMGAAQRAKIATQEISRIARDRSIPLDSIVLELSDPIFQLLQVEEDDSRILIVNITDMDAEVAQQSLEDLANDWLTTTQASISEFRETYSLRSRLYSIAGTAGATLGLVILIILINRTAALAQHLWETRIRPDAQPLHIQNLVVLTVRAKGILINQFITLLRWSLIFLCAFAYFLVITFFFPRTKQFGKTILNSLYVLLNSIVGTVVNFIPDLIVIGVTIIFMRFVLKANNLIFEAVEAGRITWPGFYPDWARPTRNLFAVLIWTAALAIIFPYLPGKSSPAIQGLGLLAGALLTVGGASTVASFISGYVIIFSRSFQVGDLISFDDYRGFVHQKSVLATQLRSLNGEILTIPNATLQSKTITNYSAIIRDLQSPLALTTTLTLGYDVPWRQIYSVLIDAALATPGVLKDPTPFVLQTSLDDFYVSYSLKVFIGDPEKIPHIYSNLLENLQDYCNAADIEIMSPHYRAMRDGNQTTIPADYLPEGYVQPGFQIDLPRTTGDQAF